MIYSLETISLIQGWLEHDRDNTKQDYSFILDTCFQLQKDYILSPSRRKVAVTGGRAGKTFSNVYYLLYTALDRPGCFVAYTTKTRQFAKDLAWRPLVQLVGIYDPGAKVNISELTIDLSNGSFIRLAGCDDEGEADKLRGKPWSLVVIDEVQAIKPNVLKYLLDDVLRARLADYKGTLACTGTPNASCSGHLYDIDQGDKKDSWTHFHWTLVENQEFPQWAGKDNWQELAKQFIEDELIEQHLDINDPMVQREYFGRWEKSLDDFILHIEDSINVYSPNDASIPNDLRYVLGIDLGYNDESGYVINGYSRQTQKVYHITDIAHPKLPMGEIIDIARGLIERYHPVKVVIDPATGGQFLVEELRRRYKIPCLAADKQKKAAHYRIWNADIRCGRYQFLLGKLLKQAKALQWNDQYTREMEGIPNDLADACLYSYIECYHYLPRIEPEKERTIAEHMWERTINKINNEMYDNDLLGVD